MISWLQGRNTVAEEHGEAKLPTCGTFQAFWCLLTQVRFPRAEVSVHLCRGLACFWCGCSEHLGVHEHIKASEFTAECGMISLLRGSLSSEFIGSWLSHHCSQMLARDVPCHTLCGGLL